MMRYLITLSVEGLAAVADTTAAAMQYFGQHPEFTGMFESFTPDEQEVS
jgi:hypothetical protein